MIEIVSHEDVRVSEVRHTDGSDELSEVGVGHVGVTDEVSEIDDNEISEADTMSEKSHETDDDELDEILDL